jgi:hypothetical protein
LRALVSGVFDYAGLFPPARLSQAETAERFGRYINGPEKHFLGDLVWPAADLPALLPLLPTGGRAWPISALGGGVSGWRADLAKIEAFNEAAGERAMIGAYEARLDVDSIDEIKGLEDRFDHVFLEVPTAGFHDALHMLAHADGLFAKLRTGGATADAYPSPETLAAFIHECVSLDLPYKLTAGLHHPFPTTDTATSGRMHGFLNVLVANALAIELDLSRAEIAQILAESDPSRFVFEGHVVQFGEWEIDAQGCQDSRDVFRKIGSCSIEEPTGDLRAVGLLSPEALA